MQVSLGGNLIKNKNHCKQCVNFQHVLVFQNLLDHSEIFEEEKEKQMIDYQHEIYKMRVINLINFTSFIFRNY